MKSSAAAFFIMTTLTSLLCHAEGMDLPIDPVTIPTPVTSSPSVATPPTKSEDLTGPTSEHYYAAKVLTTYSIANARTHQPLPRLAADPTDMDVADFRDGNRTYRLYHFHSEIQQGVHFLELVEDVYGVRDATGHQVVSMKDISFAPKNADIAKTTALSTTDSVLNTDGSKTVRQISGPWNKGRYQVHNSYTSPDGEVIETSFAGNCNMPNTNDPSMIVTSVTQVIQLTPFAKSIVLKDFPDGVKSFLDNFSQLHNKALLIKKDLLTCLAPGKGVDCSALQAKYDASVTARATYWASLNKPAVSEF